MNEWQHLIRDVEVKAMKMAGVHSIYTDFYPTLDETVAKYEKFLTSINTENNVFNEQNGLSCEFRYSLFFYSFPFFWAYQTSGEGRYHGFSSENTCRGFDKHPFVRITLCLGFVEKISSVTRNHLNNCEDHIEFMLNRMENPEMKSMLILKMLGKRRTAETYHSFMKAYGKYLIVPEHKNVAMIQGSKYQDLLPGNNAI